MTIFKRPDLPERFGREQLNLAMANMMRRQLHAGPMPPSQFGLRFEYAEVLPTPSGLDPTWLWIADSGGFERPFRTTLLAVLGVHHLRDVAKGQRLWMHLYPEPSQTGIGADPLDAVMTPWVCVDTAEQDYAIWKETGALYLHDPWDGVAEDPIWRPSDA